MAASAVIAAYFLNSCSKKEQGQAYAEGTRMGIMLNGRR